MTYLYKKTKRYTILARIAIKAECDVRKRTDPEQKYIKPAISQPAPIISAFLLMLSSSQPQKEAPKRA